jgi:hypothetical protein
MTKRHIVSKKYDGSLRDEYDAYFVSEDHHSYTFIVPPGMWGFDHRKQEVNKNPDGVFELYFKDRWYNVLHICDQRSGGSRIYSNVSMPARKTTTGIEWVDLDLDVRVTPDGRIVHLDEEEFEANIEILQYPKEVVANARAAWKEIGELAESGSDPFDHDASVVRYRELVDKISPDKP